MGVGLVETISVRLSGLPGLQVVTPAQSSPPPTEQRGAATAGKLGANLIVLGTFQRQGDRVRITYRVVNVRDGRRSPPMRSTAPPPTSSHSRTRSPTSSQRICISRVPAARPCRPVSTPISRLNTSRRRPDATLRQARLVEKALEILRGLAAERPNSAPVQAALGRANIAMFEFTKDRAGRSEGSPWRTPHDLSTRGCPRWT